MISSLSDYADFMIKSGLPCEISLLVKLHERAVKVIDNNQHELSVKDLMNHYRLQPLSDRQDEHTLSIMYRQSKKADFLDLDRPRVNLSGRGNIKFKRNMRNMRNILKVRWHVASCYGTIYLKKCKSRLQSSSIRSVFILYQD